MTEDERADQDRQDEDPEREKLTPESDEVKKAESEEDAEDEARKSINDAFD
jgi:hypothetical protein